jgi:hypothetical protein
MKVSGPVETTPEFTAHPAKSTMPTAKIYRPTGGLLSLSILGKIISDVDLAGGSARGLGGGGSLDFV